MIDKILKTKLPQKNCVMEIKPIVAKPTINNGSVSQDTDNTNWPWISIKQLINVGGNCYAIAFWDDSPVQPVITPFDPVTKTFGEAVTIPSLTYNFTMVIGTDKIYFYGGKLNSGGAYTNRLFEYDPVTKVFAEKGSGGGTARQKGCGCLIGDRLFFFSGTTTSVISAFTEYNLTSNTFINQPTTPVARERGTMVNFNGIGYLTGCAYAADYSTMKKIWVWNPSTNTWSDTTHVMPTYITEASKWTILNNELYLLHSSTSLTNMGLIMDKYTPGSGFTNIVGPSATPAQNLNGFVIDKPVSVVDVNGTNWIYAKLSWVGTNGAPQDDVIGRVDIANNTLVGDLYPKTTWTMHLNCSKIVTDIPDTAEQVSFRLYGNGEGIPADPGYFTITTPYTTNLTAAATNVYEFYQPLEIKTDIVTAFQIAYKSEKSDWGPWSNIYQLYGGGGE